MHQRIMDAIIDCLKELIDRNNQGDNASYRVSNRTISILKEENILIHQNHVYQEDVPILRIERQFGKTIFGNTKELMPKLVPADENAPVINWAAFDRDR